MQSYRGRTQTKPLRSILALALATTALSALAPTAHAQSAARPADSSADQPLDYNVPAQSLSSALLAFAEQSGVDILFAQEDVDGLVSRPLVGRFSRADALATLLPDGAPRILMNDDGALQVERARPQDVSAPDDDLVVTGSRIRGAIPAGADLHVIDRTDIDQSGQSTIHDVLRTLPQNFPGSASEATQLNSATNNISFGSSIDLRGLGADATLTLVNGRRLAPAGFGNFVDITAVPLSAVERIEVLADGASATYGSDAIGGVVNIITRDDFEGGETRLRFAAAQGGAEEINFSHLMGAAWNSGSIMGGYEFRDRNALASSDRIFTRDSDLRALGGSNFSRTTASPGNIIRIGATSVSLAIPDGQDGDDLSAADLISGAPNFQNLNEDTNILPEQRSDSLFLSARQEVTPAIELFIDAFHTDRESASRGAALMSNLTVPETNAWRVANTLFPGQGNLVVAYSFQGDTGPVTFATSAQTLSVLAGAEISLPNDWGLELAASHATHSDYMYYSNGIDTVALNAALASSNLATAFNPFGDGGDNVGVIGGIIRHQTTENDSELDTFSLKVDGPLFALPGGPLRVALGAERRREQFRVDRLTYSNGGVPSVTATPAPGDRSTDAFFAELAAPLLRDSGVFLIDSLDLSASVRREYSEDYGEAVTPKFGLNWGVTPDLALRATWGLSFKAPRFEQTLSSIFGSLLTMTPAQDPLADGGSTGLLFMTGGNPDLEPEEAEIATYGFDFTPRFAPGLRFEATYFDIDFSNRIGIPGDVLSAIANPAPYAGVLIRDPSQALIDSYYAQAVRVGGVMPVDGIELIWDGRISNLANLRVRGLDLGASYAFDTEWGDFALSANASQLLQFTRRNNPIAPAEELVDTLYNPVEWRARGGLSWSREPFSAGLNVNFLGAYTDVTSNPDRHISSWTTWDLRGGYQFGRDEDGRSDVELAFNVLNIFDTDPPFVNSTDGIAYDNRNAGPLGRHVSFEVRKRW